jgi:putative methyltransferase (TIGR04325 family)
VGEHLSKVRSFVGELPGVRQWRHARFRRLFDGGRAVGTCRGVFDSYEAAAAAAPPSRPLGYDHDDAAEMYRDRIGQIYPSDYPMMFWLQHALAQGARRVFDLGGHIGLSYYSYATRMALPQDLSWQVCDVPAVVDHGRREAVARDGALRLQFTTDFAEAAQADVLFTAGCLQYLQETLAQRVSTLPRKPEWLLVNLLPLHPTRGYWTVQSIGTAYCPYRIQHDSGFFQDMHALGYRRLDRWENLEKRCWVAFDDAHSLALPRSRVPPGPWAARRTLNRLGSAGIVATPSRLPCRVLCAARPLPPALPAL